MEIDTGASVSIISESTKSRLFLNIPLSDFSAILKTYTQEKMTLLGLFNGDVQHNGQNKSLTL